MRPTDRDLKSLITSKLGRHSSQADLAEQIGIDRETLAKFEGGRRAKPQASAEQLTKFLGGDPAQIAELVADKEDAKSPVKRQQLRIFLCHSSGDKRRVKHLYRRLLQQGFEPWLDEQKLLPGQDWDREIRLAVRKSHVILVCLSRGSVTKEGYVQKEIKYALDIAQEKPEGAIFIIPVKLEDCDVPEALQRWQYITLSNGGYAALRAALRQRQASLQAQATD